MELMIHACEGGFYVTQLETDTAAGAKSLCAKHGVRYEENMRFNSLGRIKYHFQPLSPANVWLIHNLAYDQIIGLPSSGALHKQPLHWYQ